MNDFLKDFRIRSRIVFGHHKITYHGIELKLRTPLNKIQVKDTLKLEKLLCVSVGSIPFVLPFHLQNHQMFDPCLIYAFHLFTMLRTKHIH